MKRKKKNWEKNIFPFSPPLRLITFIQQHFLKMYFQTFLHKGGKSFETKAKNKNIKTSFSVA
jgi:hypothetical protein